MAKSKYLPLPLFKSPTGDRFKFPAIFNGSHIIVNDPIAIINFHCNGFFGTKVLGRQNQIEIDSDDEYSNIQEDTKQLQHTEQLFLLLEEAFFLLLLNCIQLTDQKQELLDINQVWQIFNHKNKLFLQNYLVYHYYRSRNWIVKPGLKFGGDFLLYKDSPEECHSTYVVIIVVSDENLQHLDWNFRTRRSMSVPMLLGLNRLAEAAGKEVLVAKISALPTQQYTTDILNDPSCLKFFEIQENVLNSHKKHSSQNK